MKKEKEKRVVMEEDKGDKAGKSEKVIAERY